TTRSWAARETATASLGSISSKDQFDRQSHCGDAGVAATPAFLFTQMMVSVHLPKTAGKSFQAALTARFGESLLEDYRDFPMNTPEYDRNRAALEASLRNAEHDF